MKQELLDTTREIVDFTSGKEANKSDLCKNFGLDESLPLFVFIGRLVPEKGADLFPAVLYKSLLKKDCSLFILGAGKDSIESELKSLRFHFNKNYASVIGFDEALAHKLYAAADFLLMPSRVEPCGLNQMYALRYGTIPIVRRTGGLNDSVIDIGDDGFGFRFAMKTLSGGRIGIAAQAFDRSLNKSLRIFALQPIYLQRVFFHTWKP